MKGFWYTVEAIIAGIVVIGFLIVISKGIFLAPNIGIYQTEAMDILDDLYNKGYLRDYAVLQDNDTLDSLISTEYNHTIQICNSVGVCTGNKPSQDNLLLGMYFVGGKSTYNPYIVKLYLW